MLIHSRIYTIKFEMTKKVVEPYKDNIVTDLKFKFLNKILEVNNKKNNMI